MARYFFDLAGQEQDEDGVDFANLDEARNAAVMFLGEYLRDNPDYAFEGHWRVDVADENHHPVLHVIVATVEAPAIRKELRLVK